MTRSSESSRHEVPVSRSEIPFPSVHGSVKERYVSREGGGKVRRQHPLTSALLGGLVVLLGVLAVPGLGFGETSSFQGGSPSDVFMSTEPDVCNGGDPVGNDPPVALLPTTVEVGQDSHVLVYFASMWSGFERDSVLVRRVELFDGNGFFESSPDFGVSPGQVHSSGTIMWTFEDIDPGTYTVQVTAALYPENGAFITHGSSGANLQSCALTAFVIPVV
jgi:hypothetical protein